MIQDAYAPSPADIFNGFVGAHVLFACQEIGLFPLLEAGPRPFRALAESTRAVPGRLRALLESGTSLGVFERRAGDAWALSSRGREFLGMLGFFTWSVGGYGAFFRQLPGLAADADAKWSHCIDGARVAQGSDQCNRALMLPIFQAAVDNLPCGHFADLGCGNAGRLIDICARRPGARGLGIDINDKAVALAADNVARHGLSGRIDLLRANVLDALEAQSLAPALGRTEAVMSFMMLHDLFNIQPPIEVVRRIREAFPSARHFLFADTFLMPDEQRASQPPIFSLGFELAHAFMGVKIRTPRDYLEAFAGAGLEAAEVLEFGAPNTYLFHLRAG